MSTCKGTARAWTFSMCSRTSGCMTFNFVLGDFEHQFVMHLQRHTRLHSPLAQHRVNADHRNLDQICGRPLQRSIHRRALSKPALVGVLAVDVRHRPHPPKQRPYLHLATRLFQSLIDERAHARILLKIIRDELLGFTRLDTKLLRESER